MGEFTKILGFLMMIAGVIVLFMLVVGATLMFNVTGLDTGLEYTDSSETYFAIGITLFAIKHVFFIVRVGDCGRGVSILFVLALVFANAVYFAGTALSGFVLLSDTLSGRAGAGPKLLGAACLLLLSELVVEFGVCLSLWGETLLTQQQQQQQQQPLVTSLHTSSPTRHSRATSCAAALEAGGGGASSRRRSGSTAKLSASATRH